MTNNFRVLVQKELSNIEGLDSGEVIGDDLIEEGKYYFGYTLTISGQRYNLDYSDRRESIRITGYLSTKGGSLSKMDEYQDEIVQALSNLRILATCTDITTLDTKVRKRLITGTTNYNTLDGLLK